MNASVLAVLDDVQRICRSCLCRGDKLIPLNVPYNDVINTKYEYVDARETIGKLMMACGNVQIESNDGLPQCVCIKCFMNIRAAFLYRKMCEKSDAELREKFQSHLANDFFKVERTDAFIDPLDENEVLPEIVTTDIHVKPAEIATLNNFESPTHMMMIDDDFTQSESIDNDESDEFFAISEKFAKKSKNAKRIKSKNSIGCGTNGVSTDTIAKNKCVCEICGIVFHQISSVRQHMSIVHNDSNFECDICKRKYKTKGTLTEHMRRHLDKTNYPKYSCIVCGKKNGTAASLAYHMKFHSADRPYECDQCGQGYKTKMDLTNHSKSHLKVKPHVCSICSKSFALKANWRYHMMKHSGERPFKCDVCDASFARNFVLNSHMRTHTGDKPYQCICGERFQYSRQLSNHRNENGHIHMPN